VLTQPTSTIDVGAIVTGLGGGLALFLFGMRHMTEALNTVAGASMKKLLARLISNRFTGALAGALVTAVIQSSSATTVLVVGFLTAGLMTFPQSVGVIIGANVGTTITAQVVAFRIHEYGLLMIAVGFLVEASARRVAARQYGTALMGLGLIFFGMELMTSATGPLRTYGPFVDVLGRLDNPLLGVLAGLVFTAVVQSSSATTGLIIVLAVEGLIPLEAGVALVMGANVGTCVTAVISAIGRPREAAQAVGIHVAFNVLAVILWFPFISQLAGLVRGAGPDIARQVANAHTVFNVGSAVLFIAFTGPLARLVERLIPGGTPAEREGEPRYLDEYFVTQPAVALDRVRMELGRLARLVGEMMTEALPAVVSNDPGRIVRVKRRDQEVNGLHGAIVTYLARISQQNLGDPEAQETYEGILVANYLENMGDIVDKILMEVARKRQIHRIRISPGTRARIEELDRRVTSAFASAVRAIEAGDTDAARQAAESKSWVNEAADAATVTLAQRLAADEPARLASFQIEVDLVENLKRLNTLTRRIARVLLRLPSTETDRTNASGE
jgi:phosphate:Na+ symporter